MPRLRPENSLLLLVDMQERLMPSIHEDARLRQRAATLAKGCQLLGVPLYVTEQYPKGLGHTVPELAEAVSAAGGVLEKTEFSCVDNDSIRARLQAAQRPNVILAGVEAHICVLQTALDLLEGGFSVHLAQDAVGSRTPEDRQVGLDRARRYGADPASVESVLFELMGSARHPAFKQVQALIK